MEQKTIVTSHEGHQWNTIRQNIKIIYAWSVGAYVMQEVNDQWSGKKILWDF